MLEFIVCERIMIDLWQYFYLLNSCDIDHIATDIPSLKTIILKKLKTNSSCTTRGSF